MLRLVETQVQKDPLITLRVFMLQRSEAFNYLVYSNSMIYLFPLAACHLHSILAPQRRNVVVQNTEKHQFLTFKKLDVENAPFLINYYMFTYQ